MARRSQKSNASLSLGIILCLILCYICCNTSLAHASHGPQRATPDSSAAETKSSFTLPNAEEIQYTPVTPSQEDPSSAAATVADEHVDTENASGWLRWNPLSAAIQWAKSYFSLSTDQDAGTAAENVPISQETGAESIFRRLFSMGKLSALLSRPSTATKSQKHSEPLQYYPDQCSSALCREIVSQMQADMDYGADPCTDVNEHYCGNWMRRTKIPDGEDKWNIATDAVHESSADFLISALDSLTCPTPAMLPQPAAQDEWDSLLACSYQACMDEDTLNMKGAKPLFAEMFDQNNDNLPSLSFLVESDFDEEAGAARQADRLIRLNIESPETDAIIASIDSLVVAAGGDPTEARFTENSKEVKSNHKSLLKVLLPRLRSIYGRLNAQFFWSLMVAPHELDPTKGHTLTIAELILGLPYRFYSVEMEEGQRQYRRYLARLLRAFDTHLLQYRREIFEKGKSSNPNIKLSYDERARRIFDFEAGPLRSVILPASGGDEKNTYHMTFEQIKNSASFLDVEAIIKMYLQDLSSGLSASSLENSNGISVTKSGEIVIDDNAEITMYQKGYFARIERLLYDTKNWAVLHDYILVNLIRNQAKLLSEDFRTATDEFLASFRRTGPAVRSRRCLHSLPQWPLSRLYVRETFSQENKKYVTDMFQKVKSTLYSKIQHSKWMDAPARKDILEKLAGMKANIGYPEWLVDPGRSQVLFEKHYGKGSVALEAAQRGYYELMTYMRKQNTLFELKALKNLPDQEEWELLPHKLDAEYVVSRNEMRLTAAFLQKPVLYVPSNNASREESLVAKAVSYGGLAAFIGRELARAVSGEEIEFGVYGEHKASWSLQIQIDFNDILECLANQYSGYSTEVDFTPNAEDVHRRIQGIPATATGDAADIKHTTTPASYEMPEGPVDLHNQISTSAATITSKNPTENKQNLRKGEKGDPTTVTLFLDQNNPMHKNYEDNVGLQVAWAALQTDLTATDLDEKPLRGLGESFTIRQIFLYGWGHLWCEVSKPDFLRKQILTHSSTPSRFRSQGALANLELFAEAYECPQNTPLNPAERCTLW